MSLLVCAEDGLTCLECGSPIRRGQVYVERVLVEPDVVDEVCLSCNSTGGDAA